MMNKYTLSEISALHAGVIRFINIGLNLPVKVSYALNKTYKALNNEIELFNQARQPIIDKYAERDDEGKPVIENGNYKIKDREQFDKEIAELLTVETEVNIYPIKSEDLQGFNVTVQELMLIDFMIVD